MDLRINSLKGKKIRVLGLRPEGRPLVQFLIHHGAQVIEADTAEDIDLALLSEKYFACLGQVKLFKDKGVHVVSDLDFIAQNCRGKIIAVTGTNGKSTTAYMTKTILASLGKKVFLGGNFFSDYVEALSTPADFYLFETGSLVLERSVCFHPHIAVLTNISPNHPERHRSMEEYVNIKFSIAQCQNQNDYFIYNAMAPVVTQKIDGLKLLAHKIPVCFNQQDQALVWYQDQKIYYRLKGSGNLSIRSFSLKGFHHLEDLILAVSVCLCLGVSPQSIESVLGKIQGLPFRFEKLPNDLGIDIYNDAVANTPAATAYALTSLKKNVILITGGLWQNGLGHEGLRKYLQESTKQTIIFGKDRKRFLNCWKDFTTLYTVETLKEAVDLAFKSASPGDTILFSPGAKPEIGFGTYLKRGEEFNELALQLAEYHALRRKLGRKDY
ncbi:MAG: UDP-N-acetylmuramoyl-L-alanine--D-glutamate ligase [Deltaproteobacteria bacterium]|nr:UDP-N-acetylmuramoyl-L-alanine--D-glutamate ligase [Deltaproteobacteria bacterium]